MKQKFHDNLSTEDMIMKKENWIGIRVDDEMNRTLRELALIRKISISKLIRQCVESQIIRIGGGE